MDPNKVNEEENEDEDYTEEKFEADDQSPIATKVSIEQVKTALKELRLKLMIKKIPRTHMVKYMLEGITL